MKLKKNLFQFRARLQPQQSLLTKYMNVARKMTAATEATKANSFLTTILFILFLSTASFAQTTIQTTTYTGNGTGSGSPGTGISVNVINNNTYDVVLTDFGYSCGSAVQTQLWYSATSITGSCGSIASPAWNLIATVNSPTTVANTVITDNFFTGLSLIIPANTNYRFVVVAVGGTARYSAASAPSPTTWTAGGVTLDATTSYWGGSGSVGNTGRYFYGSVTFIPSCVGVSNLNTSNITVNSATATWTGVSGSIGYEYAITSTSTPPSSGTPTLATTANFNGLSLNTTYFIHVRNKCASGPSNWTTTSFTTLNAYCLPPANILFSNITMISAEVLWSLMPTTSYYQYIIGQTYDPNPDPALATTTTGITASATNLLPNTKYYVSVRSFCLGGNDSSWWKIDSFVTKASCGIPSLQIMIPGNDPRVEWNPILDAVAYEYRLTGSTNPPPFGTETKNTFVNLNLPNDGTNQYLHVRSKCNSQFTFSEWAMIALRETNTNSINDIDHSGTIVSAYPNPVNEWLTIEINSSNPAAATLILTDLTGSVVKTQTVTGKKMTMNMQGIASGVYLLKYNSTSHTEVLRVNKL